MTKWSLLCLAALAAPAACAPKAAPPPPPPPPAAAPAAVNPVGTFDFSTTVEGSLINGTVVITRTDNGYAGTITTTATEPLPIRSVTVEGQKLTVTGDTPEGTLTFTMEFKGDDFTGGWSFGQMAGTHSGKRRSA